MAFGAGKMVKTGIIGVEKSGFTLNLDYRIHKDNSATELYDDCQVSANAIYSGTIDSDGLQNTIRQKVRGGYVGFVLTNSTISTTWSFEKLSADVRASGRLKL